MTEEHLPSEINYRSRSRVLEVAFHDGERFEMTAEYLRVHSPSAEVRGHGPGQEVLQVGKEGVGITRIEPVGNYAVCLHFDDGHHTGIYSWDTLYRLGRDRERNWESYLQRLAESGHRRRGE
jgi:DUF971 family protein